MSDDPMSFGQETAETHDLPSELLSFVRNPERATAHALWKMLHEGEQRRAIEHGLANTGAGEWQAYVVRRVSKILNYRPQSVIKNASSVAHLLLRSRKLADLEQYFLLNHCFEARRDLYDAFTRMAQWFEAEAPPGRTPSEPTAAARAVGVLLKAAPPAPVVHWLLSYRQSNPASYASIDQCLEVFATTPVNELLELASLPDLEETAPAEETTNPAQEWSWAQSPAPLTPSGGDESDNTAKEGAEDLDAYVEQYGKLRDDFAQLASAVDECARMLQAGYPPTVELPLRLAGLREAFLSVGAALSQARRHLALAPTSQSEGPQTLADLEQLLTDVWHTRNLADRIERAEEVLSLAARVRLRRFSDPESEAKLAELVSAARATAFREGGESVLSDLASGSHPLALLVRAIQAPEQMGPDEPVLLDDWLTGNFGKRFAISFWRGDAEIGEEIAAAPPTDEIRPEEPPADFPAPNREPPPPVASEVEGASQMVSVGTDVSAAPRAGSPPAKSIRVENAAELAESSSAVPEGEPSSLPTENANDDDRSQPESEAAEIVVAFTPERSEVAENAIGDLTAGQSAPEPSVETQEDAGSPTSHSAVSTRVANPSGPSPESISAISEHDALICRALARDRLSLAYHLARVLGTSYLTPEVLYPLVLSRDIQSPLGEIAQALQTGYRALSERVLSSGAELGEGIQLIVAAGALRPGLLAPHTGGTGILRSVRLSRHGYLHEFIQMMARYGERLNGVDPSTLGGAWSAAAWNAKMESLQQRSRAFLQEQAPGRTILYSRATDVWQQWLRKDGLIRELLGPVVSNDTRQAEALRARVDHLSIESEIRKTTIAKLGTHAREKIHSRALEQLTKRVEDAVALVRQWLLMLHQEPDTENYVRRLVDALRVEFDRSMENVESTLSPLAGDPDLVVQAGALLLLRSIENLKPIFGSEEESAREELEPELVFVRDLLYTPLPLDSDGLPEDTPERVRDVLADNLDEEPDWGVAIERRMDAWDYDGARRILEVLSTTEPENIELRRRWQHRLGEDLETLDRDLEHTRRELEKDVAYGLVAETAREHHEAKLLEIAYGIEHVRKYESGRKLQLVTEHLRFDRKRRDLQEIREGLGANRQERIRGLRERLEAEDPPADARERIEAALQKGDVLTAQEYLEIAHSGQLPVATPGDRHAFREFFPRGLRALNDYLGSALQDRIVRDVRSQRALGEFPLSRVPGTQAQQAASMLEAWFWLKDNRRFSEPHLRDLLTGIGFRPIEVHETSSSLIGEWRFNTDPIQDRNLIPAATFGSDAAGNYRILAVWNRPSEEDLLGQVGETVNQPATIVFYFGRMSEQRRRGLAQLTKEWRRTFVVLDEILLLFLCGERGSRLPVFFECALPFAHLQPYITTGSLVPPEMFFGRESELHDVVSQSGPSFLYGGRQLGKTALLRHAERTYHSLNQGRIVRWIDLRGETVGYSQPPEEIWQAIARHLAEVGVLRLRPGTNIRPERLMQQVKEWLAADQARRILLLLDEADRFLELDAKTEFPQTTALKNLMETTHKRFKVVFAGLHNVVRTTTQSNHPLGHFGTPIAIGPLFTRQLRHARELVERPLRLLGFEFETEDLIYRILAQTNYYPSLIQLYGYHLLRHLLNEFGSRGMPEFNNAGPPPFRINQEHVDAVYRSRELRDAIEQRFALTLQLDLRYEVIAYVLAHAVFENRVELEKGAAGRWLRLESTGWWPQGFQDTSDAAFKALLEEMVELGVLRHTAPDSYSLRNANVLLLTGTLETVEATLIRDREPPPAFEAATFREITPVLSPLTALQLSQLRTRKAGLTVLCGSPANDLLHLRPYLERAFQGDLIVVDGLTAHTDFDRRLRTVAADRERDATTLVLVGFSTPWDLAWVDVAQRRISALQNQTATLRVLFVADPRTTYRIIADGTLEFLSRQGVDIMALAPWDDAFLRHWLDSHNLSSQPPERARIRAITGNRPWLLRRYQERTAESPWGSQPLEELADFVASSEGRTETLHALGIESSTSMEAHVLTAMAEYKEPIAIADLLTLLDVHLSADQVTSVLRWAELMSLASAVSHDAWVADPFVSPLLLAR